MIDPSDIDPEDHDRVIQRFRDATAALRDASGRRGSTVHLGRRGRLLVTGDLHDSRPRFDWVVKEAQLDRDSDHHLVLHELIHGGHLEDGADLSYRTLLDAASLLLRHPDQVHVLLANHELAQMTGQPIGKGSGCMTTQFDLGLRRVFDDHAPGVVMAIDGFIRAMPLAVRTESGIVCAHSLPGPEMMARFDHGILERSIEPRDYSPFFGSAWMMVWGRRHAPEQILELAAIWEAELFCLGHAYVPEGIVVGGPRMVQLNSDHTNATVVPIDLASPAPDVDSVCRGSVRMETVEVPT